MLYEELSKIDLYAFRDFLELDKYREEIDCLDVEFSFLGISFECKEKNQRKSAGWAIRYFVCIFSDYGIGINAPVITFDPEKGIHMTKKFVLPPPGEGVPFKHYDNFLDFLSDLRKEFIL